MLNIKTHFHIFLLLLLMPMIGHADVPDWFDGRNIKTDYDTDKIGYGQGTTKDQAYANALDDIVKQVGDLEISNVLACTKEYKKKLSKTTDKQSYSEECKKELQIRIDDLKLRDGVKTVKEERRHPAKNRRRGGRGDVYYVAIKYDDADIIVKTARLHENRSTGCKDDTNFIPYVRAVRRSIAEQFKKNSVCMLSWNLSVTNQSIDTKNPHWQLNVGALSFAIANYTELRDKFWPKEQSDYLKLRFSESQIYHAKPYHITLKLKDTLSSDYAHPFISFFSVTESGQVATLFKNKPSASFGDKEMRFPEPKGPQLRDLDTLVPEGKDITHELFLATICTENLPLSELMPIETELAKATEGHDYGRLLEIIKSNHCLVSAHPIVVKHKL